MDSQVFATLEDVLYRLHAAQNTHDLNALVACFVPDFQSEQPVHPGLEFVGREKLRKNWTRIFNSVPDLQSELLRSAIEGDTIWAEWRWCGTRSNGATYDLRGVTIFSVENNQIVAARAYMEPVQASTGAISYLQSQLR